MIILVATEYEHHNTDENFYRSKTTMLGYLTREHLTSYILKRRVIHLLDYGLLLPYT